MTSSAVIVYGLLGGLTAYTVGDAIVQRRRRRRTLPPPRNLREWWDSLE